jgi:hypothetical protein
MTQDVVMTISELGHLRRQLRQSIEQVAARLGELHPEARDSAEIQQALWHLSAARVAIETYWDSAYITEGARPPRS